MKKFKLLGAIALTLLLCMNASVLLDSNDWDQTVVTEIAYAADADAATATMAGEDEWGLTFLCYPWQNRVWGRECFGGYSSCTIVLCDAPVPVPAPAP